MSSCNYSQLIKENTQLKHKVDSLSLLVNNIRVLAIRNQQEAIKQREKADSAAIIAITQVHIADSLRIEYIQLFNKTSK